MFFRNLMKNFRGMKNFNKARGIAAARARMNPRVPRQFGGGMIAKLMQKSRNQMTPDFGRGFLGKFKFPKPPTVEEAQNRSMGNVGLLPSYMQPGGSGLPEDDTPFDDVIDPVDPDPGASSDIMPKDGTLPKQPPELGAYPLDASMFSPDMFNLNLPKITIGGMQAPDFRNLRMQNIFGRRMFGGGGAANLKPIPEGNKGLPKLPKAVRNKMGFMADGGMASFMGGGMASLMGGTQLPTSMPVSGVDMPSSSDSDMVNYQNTLNLVRQLKNSLPANQQKFFEPAVQEVLSGAGG